MRIGLRATVVWGCLVALLVVTTSLGAIGSAARVISVTVDNRVVMFDVPPEIMRGRVMVPIRAVAEMLGAVVVWDETNRTVHIRKGNTNIALVPGAIAARVDGRSVPLDVPAFVTRGRTLVPLRFISEVLGYGVTWHEGLARVAVITKLERVAMLGPISPLTFPFYRMGVEPRTGAFASDTHVNIARTVDILRAQAVAPGMHFAALPTHVAANLYNRGVDLRLINVAIWGNLYIVGVDGIPVRSMADLRGRRIVVPSRGDAPDLVFRFLVAGAGLDLAKDLQVEYVPSPMEAAGLLAAGRADLAVLSEPAVTSALLSAQQQGRRLARLVELHRVWGEVTGGPARIPLAGIVALPAVAGRSDLINAFSEAYNEAAMWAAANPQEMGALAARGIEGVQAGAAASALQFSEFRVVPAHEVRREIELYLTTLQQLSPDIIGGRLPDARFYWQHE